MGKGDLGGRECLKRVALRELAFWASHLDWRFLTFQFKNKDPTGCPRRRYFKSLPVVVTTNRPCLTSPTCGPFGKDALITSARGQVYHGTRVGLGPDYGENTAQQSIGNSNFNALEANLRYVGGRSQFLLGYTYSKSID
jgi:hypothetical protein